MSDVITSPVQNKPYPTFPLTIRADGRLVKKIKGRTYYLGYLDDWQAALEKYGDLLRQLESGTADESDEIRNVRNLVNDYLNAQLGKMNRQEIGQRHFADQHRVCRRLIDHLGREKLLADLGPKNFAELARSFPSGWGPSARNRFIVIAKSVFNFATKNYVDCQPVRFGSEFVQASKKQMRLHKARQREKHGLKMFEREEVLKLLDGADVFEKAWIHLAFFAGLGAGDLSALSQANLDLEGKWLDYPRPKTGTNRRIPLLPETIDVLRAALASRPQPLNPADERLVFLSCTGRRLVRSRLSTDGKARLTHDDQVAKLFKALLRRTGLQRTRRGFYSLRHTCMTIGCEADWQAARAILGHVDNTISSEYVERISEQRLLNVVSHLRSWLFTPPQEPEAPTILPMTQAV
jgi:integrase